jgi:hypothetical protein
MGAQALRIRFPAGIVVSNQIHGSELDRRVRIDIIVREKILRQEPDQSICLWSYVIWVTERRFDIIFRDREAGEQR